MIGQLRGKIIEKQTPLLLIDVAGVGYEVLTSMNTFYRLPDLQQEITLLIHFIVREDAQTLYGFLEKQERELFRQLIKVNGIGPKVALSILSGIAAADFIQCIQQNDAARLTNIPGVGKKTAERLIIELRNTLSHWENNVVIENTSDQAGLQEAMSALIALGYKPTEAKTAINRIYNSSYTSEELIRLALQQMVMQ